MLSGKNTHHFGLPRYWSVICIVNLLIGALLGLFMRYKIVFPFRALSQDHTLHAHYNFMFSGWVGLTLFSCIVAFLLPTNKAHNRRYTFAFYFVEAAAVGMLFSFLTNGYTPLTIFCALLNFIGNLLFLTQIWKDLRTDQIAPGIRLFLKGGLVGYLLSLPGPLLLMKFNIFGGGTPFQIRAALYYYLHFQYNGWFTFCIFSLLLNWLHHIKMPLPTQTVKRIFWLLAVGLIPGYGLSVLAFYPYVWIEIPSVFSVVTDFTAAIILLRVILRVYPHIHVKMDKIIHLLWGIATLSFFLKIIMQAATLDPEMASFAFSYRPLIIGFLHLTFLCFVTFFLIGYLLYFNALQTRHSGWTKFGLLVFMITVILSEVALFLQAGFAFFNIYLFVVNFYLFWITAGLFIGLLIFVYGQLRRAQSLYQLS